MDLFTQSANNFAAQMGPLAERLRPTTAKDLVGLPRDTGPWRLVWRALEGHGLSTNLIFWGPPGTGKTSLARVLATVCEAHFVAVNAIDSGAKELRQIGEQARYRRGQDQRPTVLFIDEIHRLNKGQQDVLLPFSERGDFVLIGATTENPSYELNQALLSRCQVVKFERLVESDLLQLLEKASAKEQADLDQILTKPAQEQLLRSSDGDARRLLTQFESILLLTRADVSIITPLTPESMTTLLDKPTLGYQKTGDDHYDCISAFIKSVRGSDPDAAVYYLVRMLESGEDPVFIARRLVILASEDIGNADPRGLSVAVAGLQAVELVGMPEASISLAQVTTYLASAPKSNASYMALKNAEKVVRETGREEVPLALRSSKTQLNKGMGYGKGYLYSHDGPRGFQAQEFLPERLRGQKFYEPKELGFEKNIRQYLAWIRGQKRTGAESGES
ncbi:MAG: replication-associated recombination protein A [Bdellovibrionales bacterium]